MLESTEEVKLGCSFKLIGISLKYYLPAILSASKIVFTDLKIMKYQQIDDEAKENPTFIRALFLDYTLWILENQYF